ncbi:hypothetical protein NDU88_001866 [Pleurodeles waltl]|uniref:Uncharacterized protein n=1 Tax=Pleurodeles waltl TaxID=8319 RepID=A0AAV7NDT1_PLEWA|nr:hypothetical protein NDU88_001866 [Pleurodeles waltl]
MRISGTRRRELKKTQIQRSGALERRRKTRTRRKPTLSPKEKHARRRREKIGRTRKSEGILSNAATSLEGHGSHRGAQGSAHTNGCCVCVMETLTGCSSSSCPIASRKETDPQKMCTVNGYVSRARRSEGECIHQLVSSE